MTYQKLTPPPPPTAHESGLDKNSEKKFPGSHVTYGSAGTAGGGDNKIIPPQEGGDQVGPGGGRPTRAKDFEGPGGPEDKARIAEETRGGNN